MCVFFGIRDTLYRANLGHIVTDNNHPSKAQEEEEEEEQVAAHVWPECVFAAVQKVRFYSPLIPVGSNVLHRGMRVSILDFPSFFNDIYDLVATWTSVPVVDVRKGHLFSPSHILVFSPYSCLPLSACTWTRRVTCFYHVSRNNWTRSGHTIAKFF